MRFLLGLLALITANAAQLNYDALAAKIVAALDLQQNERVVLFSDPQYFGELVIPIQRLIPGAKVVTRASLKPGDLAAILQTTDVYLWLPLADLGLGPTPAEAADLAKWLDRGGVHREIHFHWSQGSVLADGQPTGHPPHYDALYLNAVLNTDLKALSAAQDRAIAALRAGEVHVTAPSGTDIRFHVDDRPFNKQDGDASPKRMRTAKVRVDREIEYPAGVVRVAPIEESVSGQLYIPKARIDGKTVEKILLQIVEGKVLHYEAEANFDTLDKYLKQGGASALAFREFGLGFNPLLKSTGEILPYFGYGAGVVRMSLGANEEIGGAVRGDFVRWFFFPDATVVANGKTLVSAGKLVE